MVAKEATFLISLATEEFIKRLSLASQQVAAREKRAVVQQRDISAYCWLMQFHFDELIFELFY
jgi:histone H3/H4